MNCIPLPNDELNPPFGICKPKNYRKEVKINKEIEEGANEN